MLTEVIFCLSPVDPHLEVQTQIEIATRLGYLDKQMADNLIAQSDEVGKVINGLLKALDTAEKLGG